MVSGFPQFSATPLRIGFVTDTHIGPTFRASDVDQAIALLEPAKPDLVLLGGDYICESPRYIPEASAVFGNFASLPKLGTFAVLGNHDYSNDAPRLLSQFQSRGIRILRNEGILVGRGNQTLWIAGIDDAVLGRPELGAAFGCAPVGAPKLALWHEPDWAVHTAAHGAFLQLSGHSHGGQIRFPIVGHIAAPSGGRRYVAGLSVVDGMTIYTSRGVGIYRPPVRFRCRPEVTLITIC
jgi:predicted MPP superfamily phosphohydrolase